VRPRKPVQVQCPDGASEATGPVRLDGLSDPVELAASGSRADLAPDWVTSRTSTRRLLRSSAGTAVLLAASSGLGFLTAVLLARLLGQDAYGQYTFTLTWAIFLTVPALVGMDQFLVRGLARYEVDEDWSLMHGLLRRSNQTVLLTSLTIALAGCVVAVMWLSPALAEPFCVAMILVPIGALTLLRQGAMQAIGRVVTGQLPESLIWPILTLVGVGVLGLIGGGALTPATALATNAAGMAIACVVGVLLLVRALPAAVRAAKPAYATRNWLRASVRIMMITGVWLVNRYVSLLVLGTLGGTSETGVFAVVEKGVLLIAMAHYALNRSLAPAIARFHAQNDRSELERTSQHMTRIATLTALPICAAFVVAPGAYLGIFGAGFDSGSTALVILAVAQLFDVATGPAGNLLIMTGHERSALRPTVFCLVLNVVIAAALVPALGMTGSAIAVASSLVVWDLALVVTARRRVGVNATAFRGLAMVRPARTEN
jgi:O-antigen/teichoic acid export membrane protein